MRGAGTLSAAGDTETLEPGDLALIPPATDHTIANEGEERPGAGLGPVARRSRSRRSSAASSAEVAGYEDEDEYQCMS